MWREPNSASIQHGQQQLRDGGGKSCLVLRIWRRLAEPARMGVHGVHQPPFYRRLLRPEHHSALQRWFRDDFDLHHVHVQCIPFRQPRNRRQHVL
jgi:hypothetical protein